MKRSPLRRRTPLRKRRAGLRRGELTAKEKEVIRLAVYERAGGRCELNLMPNCIRGVLPFTGDTPWNHGHLVHMKSRGAGGDWTLENCKWGCYVCHLIGIHQKALHLKISTD